MSDSGKQPSLPQPPLFVEFSHRDLDQSIPRRLLSQVRRHPDAVAVEFGDVTLTYDELDHAANRAAREVLQRQPSDATPVAIMIEQGIPLVVAIIAVLKSGRCYAPLDRRQPAVLLESTLRELRPGMIICDGRNEGIARRVNDGSCALMNIDAVDPRHSAQDIDLASGTSLACVFYTSGSTGQPKGVADTHRNVMHNVMRYTKSLCFSSSDRMSLVQDSSFSGTVSTLFGALLNGATVLPFDLSSGGLAGIGAWTRRKRITIFHSVPSIFRHLASDPGPFPELRVIRLEGDTATPRDLEVFQQKFGPHCFLVNGFGATECGLIRQSFVSQTTTLSGGVVPVGYEVEGMEVRVVDETGDEVPCGTIGEISVLSHYLASGYWNRPTLTADRFTDDASGRRTYRTGDLGRMDSSGCLELVGRRDFRIKIGGQRVDTSDVEGVLQQMDAVSDVIVQTYSDRSDEVHLVAYLVLQRGQKATVREVRQYLEARAPRHAIPTACVFLDQFPLTPDGKVDRASLPAPTERRPRLGTHYLAPGTPTERVLVELWAETLELNPRDVSVMDSFFDLGGNSLRASQVAVRIAHRFDRDLDAANLFDHWTIRALAAHLDGASLASTDRLAGVSERAAKQAAASARRRRSMQVKHSR